MTARQLELVASEHAPSAARQALKAALDREPVPVAVLGRLLLLTSEIVTTALSRPVAASDQPLRLLVDVDERRVRVEVLDSRPRGRSEGGRFARAQYGMSFVILDRLSDRWGLTRGPEGSRAWSEVQLAGGGGEDLLA